MSGLVDIEKAVIGQSLKPPLHLWNPKLSGDIDIRISVNGDWFHLGSKIKRKSLVKLFSTLLRREDDGDYYLLTPVEKWRIQVDDTALLITDMDIFDEGFDTQRVVVTSNMNEQYTLNEQYSLQLRASSNPAELKPIVVLDYQLTAKLSRAVYYRMVEYAVARQGGYFLFSDSCWFDLES